MMYVNIILVVTHFTCINRQARTCSGNTYSQ